MMVRNSGLGRGLGALIPKKVVESAISDQNRDFLLGADQDKIYKIPVDLIEANPMQPRQVFDHEDLENLIESIKAHGILQPLIVTKTDDGYQLIAGERRLRAAKIIGLTTVPVLVREAGEQEKLELALIENIQRKNLNPIEKAVAYQRFIDEFSLDQEEVAKKVGISRSAVANIIRLLELPEAVQKALVENKITEGHAKVIAGLDSEDEQLNFLKKIQEYSFTVRDAEKESQKVKKKPARVIAPKDPHISAKEELLRGHLNTKVNINKQGGRGQIVIEFYSDEELNSIINNITK